MRLNNIVQKHSVIEFEDKYMMRNPFSGENEQDKESIICQIPELDLGEKVILDAWGSWEVHHFDDYRRRLGIYSVTLKKDQENIYYTLKREKEFSEDELVHALLSGNFVKITCNTKGLKYLLLDICGNSLD